MGGLHFPMWRTVTLSYFWVRARGAGLAGKGSLMDVSRLLTWMLLGHLRPRDLFSRPWIVASCTLGKQKLGGRDDIRDKFLKEKLSEAITCLHWLQWPAQPMSSSTLLNSRVTSHTATHPCLNADQSGFASLDVLCRAKTVCCSFIKLQLWKLNRFGDLITWCF